jgi:hypothetical protein
VQAPGVRGPTTSIRPQHVGVVDALGAGDQRLEKGHHLGSGLEVAGAVTKVDDLIGRLLDAEVGRQSGGEDEARVGHRVGVVEADIEPVEGVRESHRKGVLRAGALAWLTPLIIPVAATVDFCTLT